MIALAVVVVILLVLLALVAGMLLGKSQGGGSGNTATLTSPSPALVSSASASASSGPSSEPISGAGSLLGPGPGADPAAGRGNGGPPGPGLPACAIWVDPGWTFGACDITPVNGTTTSDAGVAWVTEHKVGASGVQWRVFIMTTTASDAYWHTKLYYSDEMGGGFTNITIKGVDTTGGGRPDLLIGFRHNKTSGSGTVLDYDVIQRASATAPLAIVMHRQLADGSVVTVGSHINDYESGAGDQYTKSDITFSGGLFHVAIRSQVAASAVPASLLP